MTIKIDKKIKGYSVVKPEDKNAPAPVAATPVAPDFIRMSETIARPDVLVGSTYKIKAPVLDHALYVTINDIILNEGTHFEERRPFEIFVNSKAMDQFQWIVALTRIMSAVFRKGGDVAFIVEEMKAVFDPHGGYFRPGGVFMPSLVAEIGSVVETHLKKIGLIKGPELSREQLQLIADKRAAFEASQKQAADGTGEIASSGFPPGAKLCPKCSTQALVILDGCQTCLNCGDSKCG
jgi:hypothetical protein